MASRPCCVIAKRMTELIVIDRACVFMALVHLHLYQRDLGTGRKLVVERTVILTNICVVKITNWLKKRHLAS